MKLGQIINSQKALDVILSQRVSAQVAYQLVKITKRFETDVQAYEQARLKLCEQYGKISEDKTHYDLSPDTLAQFNQEMTALLNTEVENGFKQLTLADLKDVKLTAQEMALLDWLIESE